jgi:hypothetical protein
MRQLRARKSYVIAWFHRLRLSHVVLCFSCTLPWRKTLEKKATTSVSNRNELTSHPGDLQHTRDYSNLVVIRTFHLNHFKVTRFSKIMVKWNVLHNPDLSNHVYAVSRPGDWLIHFGSKPMLLPFFQRFSHVVLRFSSGVGNSSLFLDESSDHGLGQRYEDILRQSPGNLGIVPKTRQRFRPRNV